MQTTPVILIGIAIIAYAFPPAPGRQQPAWFQHLIGWQKLFGAVAVVLTLLIILNPEFLALGLLGDTAFFDMLVLAMGLQMHTLAVQTCRWCVALLKRGVPRVWIPSPALSYLLTVSALAIASAASAQPADDELLVKSRDFAGIGVELRAEGQNIVVNHILPDTPAAGQKGLHVGDRIVAVAQDQEPAVQVQNLIQAARSMRGPKGTTVRVTVITAGEDESRARVVSFVRGEIKGFWGDGVLLTNGTKAPDIEMVGLTNKTSERLSDYAGKIIILEFWASWCGPCQRKMAELQRDAGNFPDWKGKVVLIAASVDDNGDIAAKHSKAKGWDQTHNVWVENRTLRAYHVDGIPTVYVIGRQGEIVAANPKDIPQVVNGELEKGVSR